jgi:hypothetical protein
MNILVRGKWFLPGKKAEISYYGIHLNYVTVPGDIASFRYYGENRVRFRE